MRLTPSHGWLEFQRLDASCSWFHPTADSGSGGWIRVAADSVPRLIRVPAAGYELQPTPSNAWLKFYTLIYQVILVNLKTYSAKYIIFNFNGLFSTNWFQLPLIQALPAASRTLKKLEEAWRSFKTLAASDSSCSGCFELRRLIRALRPISYLQIFDPDAPWYKCPDAAIEDALWRSFS